MTNFEKAFTKMTPEQRQEVNESISEMMGMPPINKLIISGRKVDAVYFHLPEEPFGFLSNWYISPFELDGIKFTSMEQYIMYSKCMEFGDTDSAKAVLATDKPDEQQKIARKASGYNDKIWAGRRQLVALRGLMAKFSQNEGLKTKLLETGDAYLVECAYHDVIWACGIRLNENERFDASNWRGTNILGFALMEVRDILKKQSGETSSVSECVKCKNLEEKDKLQMSRFELIHASCADQEADVVVNAANSRLSEGGGICGVIFSKAGSRELTEACSRYHTPLRDGEAVITPAFNMKNAKAIIHAVGPNFNITHSAFEELFYAYYNSLVVLKENGYHSISFPLISSSIFGGDLPNPVAESTKQCLRAYKKFVEDYPDYTIDVKLCAYTATEMQKAKQEYDKTEA